MYLACRWKFRSTEEDDDDLPANASLDLNPCSSTDLQKVEKEMPE